MDKQNDDNKTKNSNIYNYDKYEQNVLITLLKIAWKSVILISELIL